MAEAHPTIAVATEAQLGRGSIPNPWQGDLDALKEEIRDLKTMLGSVVKEIKELKQVKVESVSRILFYPFSYLRASCHSRPRFGSVRREHRRSSSRRLFFPDRRFTFCRTVAHNLTTHTP